LDNDLAHMAPAFLAAFFAAVVEFVEALTVILAVGTVRGWRGALSGTGLALLVLLAIVLAVGPALTRGPLELIQLCFGTLVLLFGMRSLRKAILRSAGSIPLHDEDASYAKESAALRGLASAGGRWDGVAVGTAFKITMLEGIEIVFIVVAIGATGGDRLVPASLGAVVALLLVAALGVALHRPVAMIPENTLKFLVGVMLSSFGTFWAGEGLGFTWLGEDWSIPALNAGFLGAAIMAVPLCRQHARPAARSYAFEGVVKSFFSKYLRLFVEDVGFAVAILLWLFVSWLFLPRLPLPGTWPGVILFIGLALMLAESAIRYARRGV
jgi:Ca2+/H+ antiporter, TMEM165/GDT1 family